MSLVSEGLVERQSAAQVAKLPGWVETMAVRQNGNLLLSRLDTPELWTLDTSTKQASKLLSFTGALGLTGIAELSPDVFVVIASNFSTNSFTLRSGSYTVYKVDLTGSTPKSTVVKRVPESGFFIGALYQMTISTGDYSIVMRDSKMKASANATIQEGIHGVKYSDGYVYFTNTFANTFNKIKIDMAPGKTAGSVTPINTSFQGPENFIADLDRMTYVATLTAGAVFKVAADGKSGQFASATQCFSCALGRTEKDKSTLYISTSQGVVLSMPVS
ncbi:hypothetical protein AOQ84DRAFT_398293 [Glonium stellatum]|uniref:Uncharacterized protein n=1 Tax=Glonium stellatum TaxID=574774 RepID=A0A8E2F088_9PEZI|nr:hypothetical protein AOQ84DRAFT_398293 [Glonium stellatum]